MGRDFEILSMIIRRENNLRWFCMSSIEWIFSEASDISCHLDIFIMTIIPL